MSVQPLSSQRLVQALCHMLILRFLFGMAINLFVVLPAHHPGASAPNYFAGIVGDVLWLPKR